MFRALLLTEKDSTRTLLPGKNTLRSRNPTSHRVYLLFIENKLGGRGFLGWRQLQFRRLPTARRLSSAEKTPEMKKS